ncbi:hypothetical protein LIER_24804 [Lithospermum erythrorhizon]|uniref:Uncharacterized protein n=1 Tax=Lithospermum erythrorhizon TaxID=34254 RepID=A0AAV3R4Q0_LITER
MQGHKHAICDCYFQNQDHNPSKKTALDQASSLKQWKHPSKVLDYYVTLIILTQNHYIQTYFLETPVMLLGNPSYRQDPELFPPKLRDKIRRWLFRYYNIPSDAFLPYNIPSDAFLPRPARDFGPAASFILRD